MLGGGDQNVTYRRRRHRSLEGRTEEMEESPKKTTTEEKEDYVMKGLIQVLQNLAGE